MLHPDLATTLLPHDMASSTDIHDDPASDLHCFSDSAGVKTSSMNDMPGYRVVKVLGTVYGLTVQSRNIGAVVGSAFKSLGGGELKVFTNMLYTARNSAVERMVGECLGRGGNAIIALRFDTSEVMGGYAQVCAYGTACVVEKIG